MVVSAPINPVSVETVNSAPTPERVTTGLSLSNGCVSGIIARIKKQQITLGAQ
jgi:hypothetical protein